MKQSQSRPISSNRSRVQTQYRCRTSRFGGEIRDNERDRRERDIDTNDKDFDKGNYVVRVRPREICRGVGKIINPHDWGHIDAKRETRVSDKHHRNENYTTYIKLDCVVMPPLGSTSVPVPTIFEL